MTTTTDDGAHDLLPLEMKPAEALRSYARLGLVAVVIPALVVGLLAGLYATATRAPAIVIGSVSVCAMVLLLEVGTRSFPSVRGTSSNGPAQKPVGQGQRSELFYYVDQEAGAVATARLRVAPGHPVWLKTTEAEDTKEVYERVRALTQRLRTAGDLAHTSRPRDVDIAKAWFSQQVERGQFPAESMRALGVIAYQTGNVDEAQTWFVAAADVQPTSPRSPTT